MSIEQLSPGIETKYVCELGDHPLILALLHSRCLPDGQYPADRINSVYFDTSTLSLLAEKINSDYIKTKVRLRWYGNPAPGAVQPGYLEMKRKIGVRRTKSRKRVDLDTSDLIEGTENYSALAEALRHAPEIGWSGAVLHPMVVIRYVRHRFIEPETRSRIALDSHICFSSHNSVFFPRARPRILRHGVLEVKNEAGELPRNLQVLKSRLGSRDSFSKYEECWRLYGDPKYRRGYSLMMGA